MKRFWESIFFGINWAAACPLIGISIVTFWLTILAFGALRTWWGF